MQYIATYFHSKTNRRVQVLNVEALETGSRVHFRNGPEGKTKVLGLNSFKRDYRHLAGCLV